jgi:hypothetical protein
MSATRKKIQRQRGGSADEQATLDGGSWTEWMRLVFLRQWEMGGEVIRR